MYGNRAAKHHQHASMRKGRGLERTIRRVVHNTTNGRENVKRDKISAAEEMHGNEGPSQIHEILCRHTQLVDASSI
jgi:hypothetical protein